MKNTFNGPAGRAAWAEQPMPPSSVAGSGGGSSLAPAILVDARVVSSYAACSVPGCIGLSLKVVTRSCLKIANVGAETRIVDRSEVLIRVGVEPQRSHTQWEIITELYGSYSVVIT
jgi:hypothetical protein